MNRFSLSIIISALAVYLLSLLTSGCAQIGVPTGGPRDTVAPDLVRANPANASVNFSAEKITLVFDEFVEVKDFQSNALISPLPAINPVVSSNLKTITIKLRDSLLPNTTYAINFGNSIRDINESNAATGFSYIFSTGNSIDTLKLKGKVLMAESGKSDSTLLVLLYKNTSDTAVKHRKPDYITKLKGDGSFVFDHLPDENYHVYALKDGDGNKYYSLPTEVFAFHEITVRPTLNGDSLMLFAYAEKKVAVSKPSLSQQTDKKLRYTTNLTGSKQDLLLPLELTFNNSLKNFYVDSISLVDTGFKLISDATVVYDTSNKKMSIRSTWLSDKNYLLIVNAGAVSDSNGNTLFKTDTLRFKTKNTEEYGSLKITFQNIDITRHPLLQFMDGDKVKWTFAVEGKEWKKSMLLPGEYEVRLLYDDNNNGQWDPGNYSNKLQPEKAITISGKIGVRANWDNEREVIW